MLLGNTEFDLHAGGNGPDASAPPRSRAGRSGSSSARPSAAASTTSACRPLHVINIRDWHEPGRGLRPRAPRLRQPLRGRHVGRLLRRWPRRGSSTRPAAPTRASTPRPGAARIYHVRSDSVFDFKPRAETRGGRRKFRASELEDVLDLVVQGSDEDVREASAAPAGGRQFADIHELAREIDSGEKPRTSRPVYVAVVGVYTDIKVQTLARRPAHAVRPAEPGGLGHVHRLADARAPPLRARLCVEGARRRGRARDQRPRRLPRAAGGGRGRERRW